ncbi:MAG: pitrilysin family protein [Gemmatimonadaceae bacterium]
MKLPLLLLTLPIAAAAAQRPAGKPTSAIHIPFEKYVLPNGLTVVLSEDHATPTVAVEVMYHVASKNEQVGHTGFAHMFEHVMFTGSAHVPYGLHDKYTEGVGGSNNGSTGNDVTQYYETIPSNYLQTSLWMEADRMGWLLDSLDEAKFRAQRDIVKNERRQSADNVPYARDGEVIDLTMFPAPNPYSWPVVGSMADLTAATVEDVKQFFRTYYVPNNATLVIVGDFDPKQARAWVAKYFTDIPRGKPIVRPVIPASPLETEQRLTFEDRVQVPQLTIAWPTVGLSSSDRYALQLLSDILGSSRTARLTKALVYDTQSATNASAYSQTEEGIGKFIVTATPRPGHTLTQLETITDSVLDQLKRTGPDADELQRAKARREATFLNGLQSNLGKAARLANDQTMFNDPGHSVTVDYPRTQAVTAADVKRVANKYLGNARVVLSNVPLGKTELASHANKRVVVTDPFTEKTAEVRP